MIDRRRRGLLAIIGLMVVALVSGTSILVWRSLVGASNQELLRHQQVAERIFDELEDELTGLIDKEETRSFLDYRFFYVPSDQLEGQGGLSRSSLSVPPIDDAIVGYFHIDPNGERFTPVYPRDNELALATDNGWSPTADILSVKDSLDTVLGGCESELWTEEVPEPPPPPLLKPAPLLAKKQAPVNTGNAYTTQSFNVGSNRRGDRPTLRVQTKSSNISNFEANDVDIQDVVLRNARIDEVGGGETDVVISPIRGLLADDQHLILQRQVRIGGNTHRQGLALDIAALGSRLEAVVLGQNELAPYISLGFNTAPTPGPYVFAHTFAEPFEDLVVVATMDILPGQERLETGAIWLLAMVLGFTTILGSGALYRMVTAELGYAQKRTDFVSAVSHELKTPLTSIRLYAEMLQEGMVASDEKREEYYRTITAESDRLGRLIDNVLELGRLERDSEGGPLIAGDVRAIVDEVAEMLRPHAENRGFVIDVETEPDLPPVTLDRDALTQILVNLVDNGIKFAVDADRKRLVIRAVGFGEGVQLAVRDYGPGVPATQMTEVFQPFFRGERELTRKTQGSGIGLALVQGLSERMGATLSARNHPEGGFEVTLLLEVA
jgi:signal transduction histidine kinase